MKVANALRASGMPARRSMTISNPTTNGRKGRRKEADEQGDTLILPPGYTIETMKGGSMGNTIRPGALFFVNRNDQFPSEGLFLLDFGIGEEVRRIQVLPGQAGAGPMLRVSLDDPAYEPQFVPPDKIRIAGRVVGTLNILFV